MDRWSDRDDGAMEGGRGRGRGRAAGPQGHVAQMGMSAFVKAAPGTLLIEWSITFAQNIGMRMARVLLLASQVHAMRAWGMPGMADAFDAFLLKHGVTNQFGCSACSCR